MMQNINFEQSFFFLLKKQFVQKLNSCHIKDKFVTIYCSYTNLNTPAVNKLLLQSSRLGAIKFGFNNVNKTTISPNYRML